MYPDECGGIKARICRRGMGREREVCTVRQLETAVQYMTAAKKIRRRFSRNTIKVNTATTVLLRAELGQ